MEATTVAIAITNVVKFGYNAWDAYCSEGLDNREFNLLAEALAKLDHATAGKSKRSPPSVAAQHVGLVMAAFGRAFKRHWVETRTLDRPGWLTRWFDDKEKARDKDIQARLNMAELTPRRVGDRAPGAGELADIDTLIGHPLSTPYYRELWRVFSDPGLVLEGEEPPLDLDGASRRAFERHFVLAYAQAFENKAGEDVRAYLDSLETHRTQLVRECLIADLATWDQRHVFGNLPRSQWDDDGQPLPFLPLGQMYVEPDATRDKRDENGERPILGLLKEALEANQAPYVTVVKADFGMGKSLTARTLVCMLAQRYLDSATEVSRDSWLPIFVRCADHVIGETPQLEQMVRSALRRHAEDVGISRDMNDDAFALPESDQRVLIVLDGLDEVVLGQRALEGMFKHLRSMATASRRILVMTRPGVLPERRKLEGADLLELCPFRADGAEDQPGHIGKWLSAWNLAFAREQPITIEALARRKLLELATTPILLVIIAHTWDEYADGETPSHARLYETFFRQVARGKYERDRDHHTPVHDAAGRLHDRLRDGDELHCDAEPHHAMLWLLSRLAWKDHQKAWQHRVAARLRGDKGADTHAEPLTRRDVVNVLRDELKLEPGVAATVEIGVLLSLQSDLTAGRDHIHFGHKSFREFLVSRCWADRLRKLARARERDWDGHIKKLLGARLLSPEDRSFDFLMEILAGTDEQEHSPFAWTPELLATVKDWAEDCFNDENQSFASEGDKRIQDDQRAVLREAALAIGSRISLLDDTPGLRAKTPWAMRSLLAWFWATREPVRIIAPRAHLPGIIAEVTYREVDFREANLQGALFTRADLAGADFQGADLQRAVLLGANLLGANLLGVNLLGAFLQNAFLRGVNLQRANLQRAFLQSVKLQHADLRGADLRDANLQGANLQDAHYDHETTWPTGFDPTAAGAIRHDPE